MTTANGERLTEPTTLPEEPIQLQDSKIAEEVRKALAAIHDHDVQVFAEVFGLSRRDEKDAEIEARVRTGLDGRLSYARETLIRNNVLGKDDDGYYRSQYLITPWHGMFYITDFPDSGDRTKFSRPTLNGILHKPVTS